MDPHWTPDGRDSRGVAHDAALWAFAGALQIVDPAARARALHEVSLSAPEWLESDVVEAAMIAVDQIADIWDRRQLLAELTHSPCSAMAAAATMLYRRPMRFGHGQSVTAHSAGPAAGKRPVMGGRGVPIGGGIRSLADLGDWLAEPVEIPSASASSRHSWWPCHGLYLAQYLH